MSWWMKQADKDRSNHESKVEQSEGSKKNTSVDYSAMETFLKNRNFDVLWTDAEVAERLNNTVESR